MRKIGIEYAEKGVMRFCDIGEPPQPVDNQVLLRTLYSGITNGTERHALMAEHGWKHFPGRHGYQHVCRVEAVGPWVNIFKPGDTVFYGQYVGHRAWHVVDLSNADPNSNGSHLCFPLPGDLDPKHCALLGVAGVAMRGVRRCRVAPGQNVWVAGVGLIGHFAAQAARCCGARVTVSDVNRRRLEVARETGADVALNANDPGFLDALKKGGPYDRIIDGCGQQALFLDVFRNGLLAPHGAVCALAVRSEAVFHWSLLHMCEASIEVSCHFSLDDLRVLTHFMRRGDIRVGPVIFDSVPIDEAPGIYERLRDNPQELLGVVFDWA
ncbi:MAG TPA: zinc-binding alcohol dehydrogenase [Candidatus Brocadiia bacterium]|nr:zinc-binding alcohol dehydrogenase [Candidatus Brocadiia bacterium]